MQIMAAGCDEIMLNMSLICIQRKNNIKEKHPVCTREISVFDSQLTLY